MKKFIAILFAGLFILALAACDDDTPTTTTIDNNPTQSAPGTDVAPEVGDIYFAPGGVRIEMGAAPIPVLEALGEPEESEEVQSCALKAKDIRYKYPGFLLDVTYPEQGEDYVTGIRFTEDKYTTPGGVTIGSAFEEVTAAYGADYTEKNGFYKYTQGKSTLEFSIVNGRVAQILYGYNFD